MREFLFLSLRATSGSAAIQTMLPRRCAPRNDGFSLVELSIVLVILGLLAGGILAGKSLIRAAEIRKVGTDLQKYKAASYAFRDKYFYLPGDMNNATKFWGAADGGDGLGSDCTLLETNNPATCNGDGDGTVLSTTESWNVWEHLARAALIEGDYYGEQIAGTGYWRAGVNTPQIGFPGVGIQLAYRAAYQRTANYLIVGGDAHDGVILVTPALKAEDALNIDTKLDDGLASYGKLLAGNALGNGTYPAWCTSGWRIDQDSPGPVYANLNNALGLGCLLYFQL